MGLNSAHWPGCCWHLPAAVQSAPPPPPCRATWGPAFRANTAPAVRRPATQCRTGTAAAARSSDWAAAQRARPARPAGRLSTWRRRRRCGSSARRDGWDWELAMRWRWRNYSIDLLLAAFRPCARRRWQTRRWCPFCPAKTARSSATCTLCTEGKPQIFGLAKVALITLNGTHLPSNTVHSHANQGIQY